METMQETLLFAKEMMNAGPSKGSMKVYLVGGTFAVLGIASGVVEAVSSLFPEQETSTLQIMMDETVKVPVKPEEPQTALPEDDEMDEEMEAKAKEMPMLRQRRMSFRAHAS